MRRGLGVAALIVGFGAGLVLAPSASAASGSSGLGPNEQLTASQYLRSPNGQYQLDMQTDGNLVLYTQGSRALWDSHTSGHPGAFAAMQSDGNLVVYAPNHTTALWDSHTSGHPGAHLELQTDGNLVIYSSTATPLWYTDTHESTLHPGDRLKASQYLQSPDARYRLDVRGDGDLVLSFNPATSALWSSHTAGHPGAYVVMQTDGNVVVYSANHTALWSSGTAGNPGASLVLRKDGNLVVDSADNRLLWDRRADVIYYPLPSGSYEWGVADLVRGPDGALWIPVNDGLARITTDGQVSLRTLGSGVHPEGGITVGPGNALWFTAEDQNAAVCPPGGGRIGRLLSTGVQWFVIPNCDHSLGPITAGPDGNLWIPDSYGDNIYRLTPSGSFTPFASPGDWVVRSLVPGPDGALWMVGDTDPGQIARMTTTGQYNAYDAPNQWFPEDITVGPDGELWIANYRPSVTRVSLPSRQATTYDLPPPRATATYPDPPNPDPYGIAAGPDGALWIAAGTVIARLTPSGTIYYYYLRGRHDRTFSITKGPDGAMWFWVVDYSPRPDKVGRIVPSAVPDSCTHSPSVSAILHQAAVLPRGGDVKILSDLIGAGLHGLSIINLTVTAGLFVVPVVGEAAAAIRISGLLVSAASLVAKRIANDPPDSHFDAIATPRKIAIQPLRASAALSRSLATAFNSLFRNETHLVGVELALIHSIERAQGAALAHRDAWVKRQDRAAATYAGRLAGLLRVERRLRARVSAKLKRSNLKRFRISRTTFMRVQRSLSRHGLPRSLSRPLRKLGFSSHELAAFVKDLRAEHPRRISLAAAYANRSEQRALASGATAFAGFGQGARCAASS